MSKRVLSPEKMAKLAELISFSNKYEISVQFWPKDIAVYIMKDGIDLTSFGGSFHHAIDSAINYLKRIQPAKHGMDKSK